jgi:hypothetical protein
MSPLRQKLGSNITHVLMSRSLTAISRNAVTTMDPLSHFPPEYVDFNDGGVVVRTTIAMSILSTLVVGLRVYARFSDGTLMKLDDWLIIASLVCYYLR